jgi:ribosome maturation factor RimP
MSTDPLLDPVRRHVAELGFELVEFRRSGPPQRPLIQVRIDRPDSRPGHGVSADDCARVSRALQRLLDASAPVATRHLLQISSPGFERPVRFVEHWRRFRGREVRLRARTLVGRPRARIVAVPDDDHVQLRLSDGQEVLLALADLEDAVLLTDPADPADLENRE